MKDEAIEVARRLLAGRLKRAGLSAPNPEALIQCQAAEPEPHPGGWQVRVDTWRQWSEARIKLNADDGDLIGYSVDRSADPKPASELTAAQAETLARAAYPLPSDAELTRFQWIEWAPDRRLIEMEWRHMHRGLRVDGDWIRIVLHPDTGRIVECERYWREVRLPESRD